MEYRDQRQDTLVKSLDFKEKQQILCESQKIQVTYIKGKTQVDFQSNTQY